MLKIEQAREEEEYQHKIKIRDQKNKDEYEQKKIKLNRELEQRQKQVNANINQKITVIKLQEEELKKLREAKENYDKEIKNAVETTGSDAIKQLNIKHKYESQLKAKDIESTISLPSQTIESLKEKSIEREKAIVSIQEQMATAQL